jgi:hypothetical protein
MTGLGTRGATGDLGCACPFFKQPSSCYPGKHKGKTQPQQNPNGHTNTDMASRGRAGPPAGARSSSSFAASAPSGAGRGAARATAASQDLPAGAAARAARFAQARKQETAVTTFTQIITLARKSGSLNLNGRGLTVVPPEVWQINESAPPPPAAVSFDSNADGWWTQTDLVRQGDDDKVSLE